MIQIRRNPWLTLPVPTVGLAITIAGVYVENIYLMALGVMHIILGALLIIGPAVVIDHHMIQTKNLFGFATGRWKHDGLEHLRVEDGKLFIYQEGQRAHLKRIIKSRLHPLDWKFMVGMLEKAREMAQKQKKKQ